MAKRFTAEFCSYNEALAFLNGRIDYEHTRAASAGTPEFKLQRTRWLLQQLNNPQDTFPIIHVAGTKGKGSTAAMISSVLMASGYRVGLYTSPHFERVEERFAVNGKACSPEELVSLANTMLPIVLNGEDSVTDSPFAHGPTYFELTTAMAFTHFSRRQVDVGIIEVGLGGRLDSTNVCRPLVSVITSIGMDHMAQLGNSLESIAAEKAGIIKPGVPVVSGVVADPARTVIGKVSQERGAPLSQAGLDFDHHYDPPDVQKLDGGNRLGRITFQFRGSDNRKSDAEFELGPLGSHQAANAAVALATLRELKDLGWQIDPEAVRLGLRSVQCPGRVEVVGRNPLIILDTAHNVSSVESLGKTLDQCFAPGRRILLFAASRDKDIPGMLEYLVPRFDEILLTQYSTSKRAAEPESLAKIASEFHGGRCRSVPNPRAAWDLAWRLASSADLICVTGSFFLAGELRPLIMACSSAPYPPGHYFADESQAGEKPLLESKLVATADDPINLP